MRTNQKILGKYSKYKYMYYFGMEGEQDDIDEHIDAEGEFLGWVMLRNVILHERAGEEFPIPFPSPSLTFEFPLHINQLGVLK